LAEQVIAIIGSSMMGLGALALFVATLWIGRTARPTRYDKN
jgi:hypothetical protein